jgi:phosphoglucosamine mutase
VTESARLGKARRINDAPGRYIEFCKSTFPNDLDLRGLKLVVDCAHGATYHIAQHVFHELGADVIPTAVQPDGTNINRESGATHPQALVAAVKAHGAHLGVAFDGDGDRVVMSDQDGNVYDGDQLLYVIARFRHSLGLLRGGVVGTLMTNLGMEQALGALGIPFARAAVGDRYVLEMMLARGWQLGGENSGHIICLDKHTTGDGIVSALQVMHALRSQPCSLADACREMRLYPQVLVNVKTRKGFQFEADAEVQSALRDTQSKLNGRGRVLLRASGTEPVIRVMVEGEGKALISGLADSLAEVIKARANA